ncbi:Cytosolic seryl-tRNA synthetase [Knufia peltigerae]|uniref:serine--tRNA ligase n=1 Tax=Knufia peltigerae TaxID=1002370 RepID=A0AA38Y547_9EURO|nr:Cytosolic seryl-tRNA synthetase [Knufia peltigerae]
MIEVLDLIVERGGNPQAARDCLRKRYMDEKLVDDVIALWQNAYSARYEVQKVRTQLNTIQKEIGHLKKQGQDTKCQESKKASLDGENKELEVQATLKERLRDKMCKMLPNYLHATVPIHNEETFNPIIVEWSPAGFKPNLNAPLSHHEIMTKAWPFADFAQGAKVVGHRGYFLRKWGVRLNQALINYGLDFLESKGFEPIQTPFFIKGEYMAKTAQLDEFDESLYKIGEEGTETDNKYLIATSEQALSAMYADEWLTDEELPQRLAGFSSCFRKEAGSHGRDAWGLFRVHQFEKIEQFVVTKPEDSWKYLEDMRANAEEFYQSLCLPYRVVEIVSGALNNAAAKKYDLEGWFPHQSEYKELVSCTNCTDYQTRELNVRYRPKDFKGGPSQRKMYVHALNGTLSATERTLCCLLENYQSEAGIIVPEVLKSYMPRGTPDVIPWSTK